MIGLVNFIFEIRSILLIDIVNLKILIEMIVILLFFTDIDKL